jgi:hypothetical protein
VYSLSANAASKSLPACRSLTDSFLPVPTITADHFADTCPAFHDLVLVSVDHAQDTLAYSVKGFFVAHGPKITNETIIIPTRATSAQNTIIAGLMGLVFPPVPNRQSEYREPCGCGSF